MASRVRGSASGLFPLQDCQNRFGNVACAECVFLERLCGSTAFSEAIVDGDHLEGSGVVARQHLRYCFAKTAIRLMLLACDNTFGFLNRGQHSFNIKGLDCVDIDQLNADATRGKFRFGFNSVPYEMPTGEYRHIPSLTHMIGFHDDERSVGSREDRPAGSAETQIGGAVVIAKCQGCLACLIVIAGYYYCHTRQHSHHSDVLQDLMGGTIFSQRYTRM